MGETNEPRDAGAKLTSGAAVGKVIHTDAMIPPDIIQGLRDAGMDDDAISTTIDIARAIKVEPVEFCKDTLRWLGERDKPFTVPPNSSKRFSAASSRESISRSTSQTKRETDPLTYQERDEPSKGSSTGRETMGTVGNLLTAFQEGRIRPRRVRPIVEFHRNSALA